MRSQVMCIVIKEMKKHLELINWLVVSGLLITSACGAEVRQNQDIPSEKPPNIVLILADDLGWTGLGSFGSEYYETPNIDRLAREGMKFTNGYADAPVCAPTRACLISGQYSPRTGVFRVSDQTKGEEEHCPLIQPKNRPFSPDITTIAEALQQGGYVTGHFGKWHLGPDHPRDHGFDVAIESAGKHFEFVTDPESEVEPETYLSDFMTDQALKFIEENRSRPFFLYVPDFLVHKPHEAKQNLIEHFEKKPGVRFHRDPVYAAMTASLDFSVGRIVDKIGELGLDHETLIIFTSDNGGRCPFGDDLQPRPNAYTDNLPLRDGKGELYEGGIRVPWIFRWTEKIQAGTVCDEPITTVDVYPTALQLAKVRPEPSHPLDGVSILPCLLGGAKASLDRDALFWYYPNYSAGPRPDGSWGQIPRAAIRMGKYKLIESLIDGRTELYDLEADIGEKEDLAKKLPERTEILREKLAEWFDSVGVPQMKPNPLYER